VNAMNSPNVMKRIFVPQRDEVTGGWRKLHNEELRNLYLSTSVIRMMKSGRMRCGSGSCSANGEEE
jgi:hypothetical protein